MLKTNSNHSFRHSIKGNNSKSRSNFNRSNSKKQINLEEEVLVGKILMFQNSLIN